MGSAPANSASEGFGVSLHRDEHADQRRDHRSRNGIGKDRGALQSLARCRDRRRSVVAAHAPASDASSSSATRSSKPFLSQHAVPGSKDRAARRDEHRGGHAEDLILAQDVVVEGGPQRVGHAELRHQVDRVIGAAEVDKRADVHAKEDHPVLEFFPCLLKLRHLPPARRTQPGPEVQHHGLADRQDFRERHGHAPQGFARCVVLPGEIRGCHLVAGWEAPEIGFRGRRLFGFGRGRGRGRRGSRCFRRCGSRRSGRRGSGCFRCCGSSHYRRRDGRRRGSGGRLFVVSGLTARRQCGSSGHRRAHQNSTPRYPPRRNHRTHSPLPSGIRIIQVAAFAGPPSEPIE